MKKILQQVWVMSHSEIHKMNVLLVQQFDQIEQKPYWGPFEWDSTDMSIQAEDIVISVQERYGIQFDHPLVIPLQKTYRRENPEMLAQESFHVYGIILNDLEQTTIEKSRNEKPTMKWIPFREVLDYLHKEYHSVIFFDWYKAIKFDKLP